MDKSPDAFRTISEVADWLDTPAHVLRFWESRFTQVKPVKRAGGRRYYRPADMALLGGIKKLLHDDGMTIRGVQKLLREHGVKYVASLSPHIEGVDQISAQASGSPGPLAPPAHEAIPITNPSVHPPMNPSAPAMARIADAPMAENVPHDAFDIATPPAEKIVHFSRPSSPAPHARSEPTPAPAEPSTPMPDATEIATIDASVETPVETPVQNQPTPDAPFTPPYGFEPQFEQPAPFVADRNAEPPAAEDHAATPELTPDAIPEAPHESMAESVFDMRAEEALTAEDRDQGPMAGPAEADDPSPRQDSPIAANTPEHPALAQATEQHTTEQRTTEQRTFDFDLTSVASAPTPLTPSADARATLTDDFAADEAAADEADELSGDMADLAPSDGPALFTEPGKEPVAKADPDYPTDVSPDIAAETPAPTPTPTAPVRLPPLGIGMDLPDDPDEAAADLVVGDGILGRLNHRDLIRVPPQDIATLLARTQALRARLLS